MPTIEENKAVWAGRYGWTQGGDEWSAAWGDPETQWRYTLLPRVQSFIPAGTILEIGPGHGRWTQFLVRQCSKLILVDLSEQCIRACRSRFAEHQHVSYHVTDGVGLDCVPDGTVDMVFSFDSLVHAEADVIAAYLAQLSRKLAFGGVGLLHHSNLGEYARYTSFVSRLPYRLKARLLAWGMVDDLESQWRASSMTARRFEHDAREAGLQCFGQELVNWGSRRLIDCISLIAHPGSRWAGPNRVIRNSGFMREAAGAARLADVYGRPWAQDAGRHAEPR